MLEMKNVIVHYGKVAALKDVSISVEEGSITSLIGANGAGKSTCLRAISGLVPITSGEIWFDGRRIDGMAPENTARLGIAHIPEGKRLFLRLSVYKNLMSGAFLRNDKLGIDRDLGKTYQRFPALDRYRKRRAGTLSGGEQQMLAFGRGLLANPKLFLFDEPSLGIAPIVVREIGEHIRQLAQEGATIILVEQNASLALKLSKKAYVLETGTIVLEGDAKQLANNKHVRAAYLGL